MSILKRWNGSSWVTVPDGTAVKYWNGSSWQIPSAVRYWNGSSWQPAWLKTDPVTRSYYPTFTTNLRWEGSHVEYDSNHSNQSNRGAAALGLGRYNGSYPYHYVSLLRFAGTAVGGYATIAAQLGARPVVKSATLRLYRESGVGLQYPGGYIRFGVWTQANIESLPATNMTSYIDWSPQNAYDIAGWQRTQNKVFSLSPQLIYDMAAGKSIMFSEVTSGHTTSGGTTNAHSQIRGLNSADNATRPYLTVTFDLA